MKTDISSNDYHSIPPRHPLGRRCGDKKLWLMILFMWPYFAYKTWRYDLYKEEGEGGSIDLPDVLAARIVMEDK